MWELGTQTQVHMLAQYLQLPLKTVFNHNCILVIFQMKDQKSYKKLEADPTSFLSNQNS